ncbi:septum formation initiator family protein [Francisellaceae bacterium]|nr:septum formation initiator family protein [Francisellaceae bacterium]
MHNTLKFQIVVLLLAVGIILLQLDLWSSQSGIGPIISLNQNVSKLEQSNSKIRARNNALYDEVVSLRDNNNVIEGLAREDLGLIKKGETYFQVLKPISSAHR